MSYLNIVVLVSILVLALAAPRLGNRWFTGAESRASRFARRKGLVLLTIGLAAIFARLALLPVFPVPLPGVHDEFSYLLAGDTFAHARLTNPPHPMALFLNTFHVLQYPTYASIFPPAQGGVLALGQVLLTPWVGVLLSMAAMCAAVTWALQQWFPPQWALLGGTLVLLRLDLFSYWINSYWGGAVAGIGGALVLGAFRRIIHHCRSRDALVLGIGASILANSRPVEGVIFCIPVAVVMGGWLFSRKSPGFAVVARRVLLPFSCVMVLTVIFIGYYNWRVTGNPRVLPHAVESCPTGSCQVLAWQKPTPTSTPLRYSFPEYERFIVRQSGRHAASWEGWKQRSGEGLSAFWEFFIGTALSLPFLTLPWMFRDRRVRFLLIQLFCSVLGMLSVIYFTLHYTAPLTATLFGLLVQAMRHMRRWTLFSKPVGVALTRIVVLAVLANIPYYIAATVRGAPTQEPWTVTRSRIAGQLEATPGTHLVIVRYTPQHILDNDWVYNGADINGSKVVWAREIPGQDMHPLLAYFRDRKIWLVEADASPPRLRPYVEP